MPVAESSHAAPDMARNGRARGYAPPASGGARLVGRHGLAAPRMGIAVAGAFDNARGVNRIIGIVVIAVGAWLGYRGYHQADSLAGRTRTTITDLKNGIDGKGRVAPQYGYYVVGGLLVVGGGVIALRKRA